MSTPGATSVGFRTTHILWSLALLAWSGLGNATAELAGKQWHPDSTGETPVFATAEGLAAQIEFASAAAICLRLLAAAACVIALVAAFMPRWSFRTSPFTLLASLLAAISPALVTAILPPEDPYTGDGSPMATLIGILYFAFLGTILATPGICLISVRVLCPACSALLSRLDRWTTLSTLPRVEIGVSQPLASVSREPEWESCSNGPTILYEQGFRFSFFAADGHEPPHVHVTKVGAEAKWWLEGITEAYNHGYSRADRAKIRRIITEHRGFLLEEWRRFFEGGERGPGGPRLVPPRQDRR